MLAFNFMSPGRALFDYWVYFVIGNWMVAALIELGKGMMVPSPAAVEGFTFGCS